MLEYTKDKFNPLLTLVFKTMNRLVGERDYSSQDVMHQLLEIPLQQDSREVLSLDCRSTTYRHPPTSQASSSQLLP